MQNNNNLALPDTTRFVRIASILLLLAFAPAARSQSLSYNIAALGPSTVYAGNTVYFMLTPSIVSSVAVPFVFNSVAVSNTPVPFGLNCRVDDCPKNSAGLYVIWIYPDAKSPVILRAMIPKTMPAGQYSLQVSTDVKGLLKTTTIPLRVLPPATPLPSPVSLPAGPIPNLAKWQTLMTQLGKKWCDPTANYGSFGTESLVWYYDGARVFFQIAEYTGDESFNACALNIARQYRDYVIKANGQIPTWHVFTKGLRMAYERTGDPSYRTAIKLLATYGFVRTQTSISENGIRETAYALESVIDAEKAGEPRSPHLYRLANYLIGHYDRIFITQTYVIHQTFFDGLAAEALIEYYELTGDPRIPPVIRTMLDWMWDSGWDKTRYKLVNNPDPVGPTCASGCQVYYTGLINLVAPAFAWYWSVTGDSLYLQRGDEFFEHSLDEDISYNGKIFSQNYRWSFDYVRFRPTNACEYSVSWPSSPTPAAGGVASVTVQTGPSCAWTVQSASSWATADGETRTGGGVATVNVAANTTTAVRTAALTVAGKAGSLNQSAAAGTSSSLSTVTLAPATVPGGTSSTTNAVSMNTAPAAATTVQLKSSNTSVVSVPASLVVPAGSTSAPFTITTTKVTQATTVTVTATYAGVSKTATLSIQPADTSTASLASFWLYPSTVKGGATSTNNRVTLAQAAGANGAVVKLVSSNPNIVPVPAQVTVAAGETYASFPIVTASVNAVTTVTMTASIGTTSKTATLTVNPVEMLRVDLSPTSVIGGKQGLHNRIAFDGLVPAGAAVTLASSNPSLAIVPASVAGDIGNVYTAAFTVTTTPVTAVTSVTISATYRGVTKTAVLTLNPSRLTTLLPQQTTIPAGDQFNGNRVILDGPAPATGAKVVLKSSLAAAVVPATVTIPAGSSWVYFSMTAGPVSATQTGTITATYGGVTQTSPITVTR